VLDYWYMTDPEYWAKVRPGGRVGKMPAEVAKKPKPKPKPVRFQILTLPKLPRSPPTPCGVLAHRPWLSIVPLTIDRAHPRMRTMQVECVSVKDLEARWEDALANHVGVRVRAHTRTAVAT
jgi:hypothetical protein